MRTALGKPLSEYDALVATAGLDATLPTGEPDWRKRLDGAEVLIGTRRRQRSKRVERVQQLEAQAAPLPMVIWQEPAPPPSVSEASSVSADPVYVGPRCRRGHPMPGQRCRACYEAERGPRRGAQQPANQYETAVADGWTAEQG